MYVAANLDFQLVFPLGVPPPLSEKIFGLNFFGPNLPVSCGIVVIATTSASARDVGIICKQDQDRQARRQRDGARA